MSNTRKPIKHGLDFLRGSNWKPRMFTRKGAQRYADQEASAQLPKGFWAGRVSDCGEYFRVNIGGQPE
jgi:hypothetical protein